MKKISYIDRCLGISYTVLIITFIAGLVHQSFTVSAEPVCDIEEELQTDTRPLEVVENQISYTTSDLTIQDKEASKYVVHEYTEQEMQTELYDDSLELLAICVEAEAGNQDFYGKCLVVDVILNRVDSDRFPNDITSVITQDYQFSSLTDGNMDKVWEPSEETYKAVKSELMDRTDYQVLFFTEGQYNPYCEPMFKYGDHYFGK